jgi:hypothetical protein
VQEKSWPDEEMQLLNLFDSAGNVYVAEKKIEEWKPSGKSWNVEEKKTKVAV